MKAQTTDISLDTLCTGMSPPQNAALQTIGNTPARREGGPPSTGEENPEYGDDRLDTTLLAAMSFDEVEAAVSLELERIRTLPDPLEQLSEVIDLMQGANFEMLNSMAPVLIENARIKADAFAKDGKLKEDKREGNRTFNAFTRLEETIIKVGVAKVKVEDERKR